MAKKITPHSINLQKRTLAIIEKASEQLNNRKSILYKAALVFSVLLLMCTTIYAAYNTSNYFSTNSDAIIATHQFSKGLEGNTVALPGSHSNVLMMPLLYMQGHLPYRYKSFTAVNILLVLATICAWAILLIKLFGRRYEIPIIVLLSSLIFASTTFSIGIGNTTFRNIAFPIALWFIFIINDSLRKDKYSRKELTSTIIGSVLFCVVLAGDSFFNYAIIAPLVFTIFWYWFQSLIFTKKMLRSLCLIVGVVVGALAIKWLLAVSNLIYFDHVFLGKPIVLPSSHLGPSIQVTLRQLMELQGGSIFGLRIGLSSLAAFMNLGILLIGVLGLMIIVFKTSYGYRKRRSLSSGGEFIFVVLAFSYFVILIEYVLSGYAVIEMQNGQIIDFMNTRYLTLLPLISIVGFLWILKHYYNRQVYAFLLCVALIIGIGTSYSFVDSAYNIRDVNKPAPSKSSINAIIGVLNKNNVNTIVTDFWYGPPIRFWSSDAIHYAPQIQCNQPIPFDSREDWFEPQKDTRSALIVDRGGLNFGYWSCTDEELVRIYGVPESKSVVAGIGSNDDVSIWVYDYDVRERLQPFPSTR